MNIDSINFKNSSLTELHILYNYLIANPHKKILMTGHTDNEGSKDYNKQLSLERAMSVKKWLVEEGIDPLRITCAGKGFDVPLENNNNEQNKSLNRRVEFEVIKN